MPATVLPPSTDFTGASVTEGQFKTAITSLHDFVAQLQTQATDVASASTCNIGAAAGNYLRITGTTTITAFDSPTAAPNVSRIVRFAGALTLTHNATSLILPGGANITTAAGDIAVFVHEGSGNWRCIAYQLASGYSPKAGPGSSQAFSTGALSGTSGTFTGEVAIKLDGGFFAIYNTALTRIGYVQGSAGGIMALGSDGGALSLVAGGTTNAITFTTNGTTRVTIDASGNVTPFANGTQSFGSTSNRWSQVWCTAGAFNSSDARLKTEVSKLSPNEIKAAQEIAGEIGTYQWLEAIQKKGADKARKHIGLTVQRAIEIMTANNLDPFAYGFIGYDRWEDEIVNHPATEGKEAWTEVRLKAGDAFSFRYDELNIFISRGQQAAIDELNNRLVALEAKQ